METLTEDRSLPRGGSLHARQLRLREELFGSAADPVATAFSDENRWAVACDELIKMMMSEPSPKTQASALQKLEEYRRIDRDGTRLRLLDENGRQL
jgi:hypothetical protein